MPKIFASNPMFLHKSSSAVREFWTNMHLTRNCFAHCHILTYCSHTVTYSHTVLFSLVWLTCCAGAGVQYLQVASLCFFSRVCGVARTVDIPRFVCNVERSARPMSWWPWLKVVERRWCYTAASPAVRSAVGICHRHTSGADRIGIRLPHSAWHKP